MKMKIIPSVILLCLCFNALIAQHISDFVSLSGDGQDENFRLPSTHTFQYILEPADLIFGEDSVEYKVDFTGYVPIGNSSDFGYLSINSESAPGAVTILDIELDATKGKWMINNSQRVDFSELVGTVANCSGTVTSWGTVITCEEYTSIELTDNDALRDLNLDGYHDFGWAIEIDPVTKEIIDQDGDGKPDKLWEMGNFKHENAAVHVNNQTVYQGADNTSGEGFLFKFVSDTPEELGTGDLYVYQGDKSGDGNWLLLDNKSKDSANATIAQCLRIGATNFGGIEDVEINPIDGMVYFAVKREDIGSGAKKGVVYRFKDSNSLDGTGVENFKIYAGGDITYNGVEWGNGTDNLVFDDKGNLWVAQDESGSDGRNYIWLIEDGHDNESNSKVKIFARTPKGSEPTGLTFSPDHKYLFMSIQHPNSNNATAQPDAFNDLKIFNKNVTLVVARDEHLNADLLNGKNDIIITQTYHDQNTDSKWIELKNISGSSIEEGSYFLTRFNSSSSTIPIVFESIPKMDRDEVLLFKNQNATMPNSSNMGSASQIESDICDFEGDDILLISTSAGELSHSNRLDLVGTTVENLLTQNNSVVRKDISTISKRDYDANNWINITNPIEINSASPNTNLAIGTHEKGTLRWDGTNWNGSTLPDLTRTIEINGTYSPNDGGFSAFDLLVNSPISFEAESTESIVLFNNLVLNDDLSIGDTESLVMFNNQSDAITGNGVFKKIEKSNTRNDIHDITYWSTPTENQIIEDVFNGVDPNRIYYYDPSKTDASVPIDFWTQAIGTEVMTIGVGYAAEGPENTTGVHQMMFTGKPNNGDIIYGLKGDFINTDISDDYNLIGNPYPCAIDIDSFFVYNKENIDQSAYFWTHSTAFDNQQNTYDVSDYAVYNKTGGTNVGDHKPSNEVGSGQGFFVRALNNEDIKFKNSMRIKDANTQFFKSNKTKKETLQKDRIWLNIATEKGNFNQILVGFFKEATDSIDLGYDAYALEGGNPIEFYSLIKDSKFKIQGRSKFTADQMIRIGFENRIPENNIYISIDDMEGELTNEKILLLDKKLNVSHDLTSSPYYFEEKEIGDFPNRFELIFNTTVLSEEYIDKKLGFSIYTGDDEITINSNHDLKEINIYDLLGRPLITKKANNKKIVIDTDQIATGSILIIEATFLNNNVMSKKTIKF